MKCHNIFQINYESKEVEDIYHSAPQSSISPTQQKLMSHFGSSLDNRVSYVISKEVDKLRSAVAQNMIDVWHQSGVKSWQQFLNNSAMSNLSQYNQNTFSVLQNYQTQFTKCIYAPLYLFLSSMDRYLYKGAANNLIENISAIYNHLKLRNIPPNCCMQIDFRSQHDTIRCNAKLNSDVELSTDAPWNDNDNDNDADGIHYQFENNKPPQNIPKTNPMPAINKMKSFDLNVNKDINRILRQCIVPLDSNICNYKRYELLLNGTDIKLFEAQVNNTFPDIKSLENAPLCLIFNSISSAQQMIDNLCSDGNGNTSLINVSFHVYYNTISVYIYVSDSNGKLFGSRIFEHDLLTNIPLLFEETSINKSIMNELKNYLQFKRDQTYQTYYSSLLNRTNHHQMEQKTEISMQEKLERIVAQINAQKNKNNVNLETVKQCFAENGINDDYFRNRKNKRKDLRRLLQKYDIKAVVALKIWNAFTKQQPQQELVSDNHDENEVKISADAHDNILQTVMEHQQYLEQQNQMQTQRIQRLENELRYTTQENNDLKRTIQAEMNDHDEQTSNQSNDMDEKKQILIQNEDEHKNCGIVSLILNNSPSCFPWPEPRQLNKNDTMGNFTLHFNRLHHVVQQLQYFIHFEGAYLSQFMVANDCCQSMKEAAFVLWLVYWFMVYQKMNKMDELCRLIMERH